MPIVIDKNNKNHRSLKKEIYTQIVFIKMQTVILMYFTVQKNALKVCFIADSSTEQRKKLRLSVSRLTSKVSGNLI